MKNLLAENPFGTVTLPGGLSEKYGTEGGAALGKIIQIVIWVLIVGAGVYALFNFVLAGYSFLSAGDDPKKITGAWAKIWQTALGLAVAAASIMLAAIFGKIIFGSWDFILNPTITPIQ